MFHKLQFVLFNDHLENEKQRSYEKWTEHQVLVLLSIFAEEFLLIVLGTVEKGLKVLNHPKQLLKLCL